MRRKVRIVPAAFVAALTLALSLSARAEISLPPDSAVYGRVIEVSSDLVVTIETDSGYSGETKVLLAKIELNSVDPLVLAVLLEGRHVFCFPARQATTEQYLRLSSCMLQINNLPGFFEKMNFISLQYVLIQITAP